MAADPTPSKAALSLLDNIASLSTGFKNGESGAREGLLDACRSLIAEVSHPSENMLDILWAQPTHLTTLWLAVEIQLFQAMHSIPETGASSTEIARRCDKNVDPIIVARMLRHLAAMGTVRETGPDTFANTPTSRAFAEEAYQDSILFIAEDFQPVHHSMKSYFEARDWKCPDSGLDAPFQHTYGCKGSHYFEYMQQRNPEMGRRPEIVELAKLGPGAEAMSHDFMTEQPVKGARAYYLHSIIQDWNDDVNSQILKAIVPAMTKGYSKVLVNDFVVPDQGAHWVQSKFFVFST
ncbi:uncharacterized protein J4E88_010805 [Alternaria novae-zelandiae]|uniref:uncharacterized protein n=1 Tax=Alternaria novae-zelandiae TaxID=430562 RepID=UPI0020C441FD|nr:uncharacterized protein J4E88_010805 [Alternaria novae-zelandiae]KAI4663170.1 hypothetical protein J4E88_010805 [Alternaria novae-zelandiae]